MQDGTWDGAISTHNTRVFVNYVEVPVRSVTVERGMRDGHPVAKGVLNDSWCIEATVEWATPDVVTAGQPEPFSAGTWLPKDGDRVEIQTGEGTTNQWWTIHTGVIDETTGSFRDGTAQSRTVDKIEELGKSIHYGALLAHMTPWHDSLPTRRMGLQSTFMVDRIFRETRDGAHGWYATPPRTWQTVGAAPCNGSMWPEVGTLWSCYGKTDANFGPSWYWTDWGVAPADIYADTRLTSAAEEVTLTVGISGHGLGEVTLTACNTDGDGFLVGYDANTDEIIYGTAGLVGGQKYRQPRNGASRVAVHFKVNTSSSQTITLRTEDGREFTHDPSASQLSFGWAADRVILESNQASLGWWVCESRKPESQRWATLEHVPTARIRVQRAGEGMPFWRASRDVPWDYAGDWLAGQVDAECAAMWLDEQGHMQWAGRGILDDQTRAQTITSELAVDDVQWESKRASMARGVWVDAIEPFVTMWSGTNVEVWTSNSVDVGRGESVVSTASVPGDEDWIAVDSSSTLIMDWGYHPSGSQHSGTYYTTSDGVQDSDAWGMAFNNTISSHGLREWRVTTTGWDSLPVTHRIKTVKPQSNDSFIRVNGGRDGLLLRARAKVTWSNVERSVVAGEVGPPRYSVDVGWRVQDTGTDGDGIGNLLSFLKGVVSSTNPTVQGLAVEHDPRRTVGDKIRVEDPVVTGVWIELICGDITTDTAAFTDEINGRITDWGSLPISLPSPSGWTQMTPPTDWTREKVD